MRLLIILLPIVCVLVGFAVGAAMGRRRAEDHGLTEAEHDELQHLRQQRLKLLSKAGEHVAYNDHFATIAIEILNEQPPPHGKRALR